MTHANVLDSIIILLSAGLLASVIAQVLKLPKMVGLLMAGMIVGPWSMGWVQYGETVEFLAEMGVVFLLFDVGLHFSIKSFWAARKHLFGTGPLQVGISGAALATLLHFLIPLSWLTAIVIGFGLALSSTAVVMQLLTDANKRDTPLGRTVIGVLIFQDLCAVFLLMLTQNVTDSSSALTTTLLFALIKLILAVSIVAILGRLLRPLYAFLTSISGDELFTAAALLLVFSVAWLTGSFGLSMPLGAFLAGMILSESEYCYLVKTEMKPFRGLLLALFFITIGMQINLAIVLDQWMILITATLCLLAVKAFAAYAAGRLVGGTNGFAIHLGGLLAQGSEFAFILIGLLAAQSSITETFSSILIATVVLTMAVTPWLDSLSAAISLRIECVPDTNLTKNTEDNLLLQHGRVLIEGITDETRLVARGLFKLGQDYVILTDDSQAMADARTDGYQIAYGTLKQPQLLTNASSESLRALILTVEHESGLMNDLLRKAAGATFIVLVDEEGVTESYNAVDIKRINKRGKTPEMIAAEIIESIGYPIEQIQAWQNEFLMNTQWEKSEKSHAA